MRLLLLSAFALCISSVGANAQSIWPSTLNASGGSAILAGNTYEWSVGEMTLVSTESTSSLVITQGLLQTRLGTTDVKDHTIMQYLSVFPNPASSTVNYTFNSPQKAVLGIRLVDMTGKVLYTRNTDVKTGINTGQVDMSPYAAATYMLQVDLTDGDNQIGSTSYKIQKVL